MSSNGMRERPPSHTTVSERSVSLVVLGTGHGSSMVYGGVCSASYVLCVDKDPVLLVGAGYGVVQQCLKYFNRIPSDVFITSNRSHMAAELPVMLACEANRRGEPLRLLGHPLVLQRIESHRLAELHDVMASRADGLEALVQVCPVPPLNPRQDASSPQDEFEHAGGVVLQDAPGISVRSFVTDTSEISAGVAVFCSHSGGARLFAICGDSRDPHALFRRYHLNAFHVVMLDGRKERSTDHSSFEDIFSMEDDTAFHMHIEGDQVQQTSRQQLQRWFIGHYGGIQDAPTLLGRRSRIQPVVEGTVIHTKLLVALKMHEEVGSRRFVNAEHHGNTVAVDEVRVTVVRDVSQRATHIDPGKDLVLPPEKNGSVVSTRESRRAPHKAAAPTVDAPQRTSSPSLSRLQQATQSSSFRRNASTSRMSNSAPRRSLSAQRARQAHSVDGSEESLTSDAAVIPPKRVYLFTNEDKGAPGRMLMVQVFRNVLQLKQRAAEVLSMKPIGELHVMPSGDVVTSLEQLSHGCSVVVTKVGGERFHMHRLPKALSMLPRNPSQTDGPQSTATPSPPRVASTLGVKPESPRHQLPAAHSSSVRKTLNAAAIREDDGRDAQFQDYLAQAAAILSGEHRHVSIIQPKNVSRHTVGDHWGHTAVAGSLPHVMSRHSTASSDVSDVEDIFGNPPALVATEASIAQERVLPQEPPATTTDAPSDGGATIASSRRSSIGSKRMVFTMVA